MLSSDDLITLYRKSHELDVLSVYLDAGPADPSRKSSWHRAFRDGVREARASVAGGDAARGALDAAAARLSDALGDPSGFLPGRGWVGFATADRLLYGEAVPVPMPNLVRFERGIRVAPYLRALRHARPVGAAVIDGRRAQLYRYRDGRLERGAALTADLDFGDLDESTGSKRAGTHTGMRGATGRDRGEALSRLQTTKMLDDVATRLAGIAGPDGLVVLGGVEEVVAELRHALPAPLAARTAVRTRLSFDLPDSGVLSEIETAASELSRAQQEALLEEVLDLARSGGAACIGRDATERALEARNVRTVLVSESLRLGDADAVDRLVGRAFEGGASAIELAGDAATRLDTDGEGIAALLHYRAS